MGLRKLIEDLEGIYEGTWQKFLTAKDLKKLPPLYSQENERDPMVWVKFFNPYGSGTWLATEFDGKDMFFGYVMGLGDDELGYFSLGELKRIRAERDQYWKPVRLSQAKSKERGLHGEGIGESKLEEGIGWLWAFGPGGDPEVGLDPLTGDIQVGMGGEWWNGKLKGAKTVLHHKKERIDPAYAPVTVVVSSTGNSGRDMAFEITGGFGGDLEGTVIIGQKR